MAKGSTRKRLKPKDTGRKPKKKISPLATSESVTYVDYKDVDLLRRFMSDRAKIRSRRVSGNDSQQQREVARAIKNAREMGLAGLHQPGHHPASWRPPRRSPPSRRAAGWRWWLRSRRSR